MTSRISVAALLNDETDLTAGQRPQIDIHRELLELASLVDSSGPTHAPPEIAHSLRRVISYLSAQDPPQARSDRPSSTTNHTSPGSLSSSLPLGTSGTFGRSIQRNYKLNRKTTLSTLYTYNDAHAYVEYPETGSEPVGFLLQRDPAAWRNPAHDFAYSLGTPSGRTKAGDEVECVLLVDKDGKSVPCVESHFTCQGSKVCPQADIETLKQPHSSASRTAITERLQNDRESRVDTSLPEHDIFRKTAALIAAVRKVGCGALEHEETTLSLGEQVHYNDTQEWLAKIQRGYKPISPKCRGRIVLEYYDEQGQHKQYLSNRDHYIQYIDESYDFDYLEAYFHEDTDELDRIEQATFISGFGPLAECTTVANSSSQQVCCPCDHRSPDGYLVQLEMQRLPCHVRYRVFEPLEAFRDACPFVLVISKGLHCHPIPLPQKTPPHVQAVLAHLLGRLGTDLADLTPRRFLWHPVVKNYLEEVLLDIPSPTLSDLHISLANRERLDWYIEKEKCSRFPSGTGWDGIKHMKEHQDLTVAEKEHYIRKIIELPPDTFDAHEEDEPLAKNQTSDVRMVICMSKEGSRRLLDAQYLQSDIGFKRVVGYYEFELACVNRVANTSVIFCRVFLNRQTAVAHQRLFQEIEDIVKLDTGKSLRWRHIHGRDINDTEGMILHFAADQHRGQAKGLGLHLQNLAQKQRGKYDLHEPRKLLSDLSAYEHLHRIFRLCTVHGMRNIHDAKVTEDVRDLMRSLICISHRDWDGTVAMIHELGGKVGTDWVQDKITSKFAFQGLCWEKSYIPLSIWKAGEANSNLIESVHADVNREGVSCTLVGGVSRGKDFDNLKMKTLLAWETAGIRPSYASGHLVENVTKSLKRKYTKIEAHNKRYEKADNTFTKSSRDVDAITCRLSAIDPQRHSLQYSRTVQALEKAEKAKHTARVRLTKEVTSGKALRGTGSGKIVIILPLE
ncbi:hypothetical protein FPV67DRAFT_1715254 [Lyophyllum atratum]|nr:hypothetical protein FPV67DRAFT_1715254 [Lyophyllum atratum]